MWRSGRRWCRTVRRSHRLSNRPIVFRLRLLIRWCFRQCWSCPSTGPCMKSITTLGLTFYALSTIVASLASRAGSARASMVQRAHLVCGDGRRLLTPHGKCFVRTDVQCHMQTEAPRVGDGLILPLGWQFTWDEGKPWGSEASPSFAWRSCVGHGV